MCLRVPSHQDLRRHAHSKSLEEIAQKEMQVVLHLPTTPTVQGGWTTCARVRRLSMPIACLSSAMAFASHGTGQSAFVRRALFSLSSVLRTQNTREELDNITSGGGGGGAAVDPTLTLLAEQKKRTVVIALLDGCAISTFVWCCVA